MSSNTAAAAAAYKAARVENAPPLKLVQMLYEGALRFLGEAEAGLAAGDSARFQERCLRAEAIVNELCLALDPAHAPELAERLDSLYRYAAAEIRRALLEETSAPLAPARDVLAKLLDGWKALEVHA